MLKNSFIRRFFTANNLLLLLLFCILLLLPQVAANYQLKVFNVLLAAVMYASIFSFQKGRRKLFFNTANVMFAVGIVAEFVSFEIIGDVFRAAISVFFVVTVFELIRQTTKAKQVTVRVIADSISGYLLIGIIQSLLVKLIYQLDAGAIKFPDPATPTTAAPPLGDLIYYTFVTYTSTGYGDILPVSPAAKSLAVFIAISGQIYVAIIISLLVGKFAGTDFKED
ncbi:MAG TPA: potassium channel family protein [Saprospiraceae bacterium]|nr:potassium channel family protein [Saprospiraceae bacterium]